jgi:hypothetical protein
MKVLSLLLLLLLSTSSFAKNSIQKLLDDPENDAFVILKNGFDAANSSIFFSTLSFTSNCVRTVDSSNTLADTWLFPFNAIRPGKPSKGPLFPGTPDILKPSIAILETYNGSLPGQEILNRNFDSINSEVTDISIIITDYSTIFYPYTTSFEFRKAEELVFFKSQDGIHGINYGYCWQNN